MVNSRELDGVAGSMFVATTLAVPWFVTSFEPTVMVTCVGEMKV